MRLSELEAILVETVNVEVRPGVEVTLRKPPLAAVYDLMGEWQKLGELETDVEKMARVADLASKAVGLTLAPVDGETPSTELLEALTRSPEGIEISPVAWKALELCGINRAGDEEEPSDELPTG